MIGKIIGGRYYERSGAKSCETGRQKMNPRVLIPNAETQHAIADARSRKGVTVHKSVAEFRKALNAVSVKGGKAVDQKLTKKAESELSGKI
jgi:hypothetical protein